MKASDFRELWAAIARPARGRLAGRRVSGVERRTWVALDAGDVPHLLVEVPAGSEAMGIERTQGLDVAVDEMRIGDEPPRDYVALACLDANHVDTFAALCAEVVVELDRSSDDAREIVRRTVRHWRRFWAVPRGGLSRQECLGLFGELWFLERWLGARIGVGRWTGADASRHDFQWSAASVEIKTTAVAARGQARHVVHGLDQLDDPETGQLYVFSLQVADDDLAGNTLPRQVERIEDQLRETRDLLDDFREKLSGRGFSPGDTDRYDFRWRIVAEELYEVREGFPRLTRRSFPSGVPAGVGEVSYAVDMAACAAFLVATSPDNDTLRGLVQSAK